jgi:hypothetical protein
MASRTIRQRPAIFQKTEEDLPALGDRETESRQAGKTARSQGVETAKQLDTEPEKPPKIKATFHLEPADIIGIDTLITSEFRRTGHRPLRSEIVSRGILELLRQQNAETSKR